MGCRISRSDFLGQVRLLGKEPMLGVWHHGSEHPLCLRSWLHYVTSVFFSFVI